MSNPFQSFNFIPLPRIQKQFTAQQIVVGRYVSGSDVQIYINNLDWTSFGMSSSPPMVLSLGSNNALVDITSQVFSTGVPEIFWSPRVGPADFNEDGFTDLYIADGGADIAPWPGGQSSVLVSNGGKALNKDLYGAPSVKTTNHGFGIGDIDGSGHLSVLNTSLRGFTEPGTELLVNDGQYFVNSPNLLPSFLTQTWTPSNQVTTYSWGAIVDLTGSGRGDLILGEWPNSSTTSFVLLNDGKGDFSKAEPIPLPDSGIKKPSVVQITPIDIFGRGVNDLVLSITPDYSYPYLQFLRNDGNGQFTDITKSAFQQPLSKTAEGYDWNIFVTTVDINCDGRQDLLVQGTNHPSYMLVNNGNGSFNKLGNFGVYSSVTTVDVHQNGVFQVISTDQTAESGLTTGLKIYNTDLLLGNYRYFYGSANEPNLVGTQYNDIFTPGFGKEYFDGTAGIDCIKLNNALADYSITRGSDSLHVTHLHNRNIDITGSHVERLKFSNTMLGLDVSKGENAGSAYRIYKAAFDRAPDGGGLGFWINAMDDGASLTSVASGFISSPEFQKLYGTNVSDRDYVTKLYNNVLDRNPDQGGYDFWLGALANGASREDILVNFSESKENIANVAELIANGIQYQEWLG